MHDIMVIFGLKPSLANFNCSVKIFIQIHSIVIEKIVIIQRLLGRHKYTNTCITANKKSSMQAKSIKKKLL